MDIKEWKICGMNMYGKMEHPLVTVVIPVCNRENTILRAVNSVLWQTYENIEVIVVDDGSTDSTVQVVESCSDDRVRVIRLSHNHGANYARNRGIEQARGEFVAFQDSDDEWLEDKLDRQISYMLKKCLEGLFCPYILCDGVNTEVVPCDHQNVDCDYTELIGRLKRGNIVGTPTLVVRKNVFSYIGLFDEKMRRLQDYEFVIRFVKKFRLGYIEKPLVKAYKTEKSISADRDALLDAYMVLAKKHFDFIDLDHMIQMIFEYTDIFTIEKVDWRKFDALVDLVKEDEMFGEERRIYKIIIECFCKKYIPIRHMLEEWFEFIGGFAGDEGFAIYGAGTYGHKVYRELKKKNCTPNYYLVTKRGKEHEKDGIPIIELEQHTNKQMPVIIAVSWEKQKELIRNLQDHGICRFCIYPYC